MKSGLFENHENQIETVEVFGVKFAAKPDGFVDFGKVANQLMDKMHQYASAYTKRFQEESNSFDDDGTPKLGQDLRFRGNDSFYGMEIHKDDIETFIRRYYEYMNEHDQHFQHRLKSQPESKIAVLAKQILSDNE